MSSQSSSTNVKPTVSSTVSELDLTNASRGVWLVKVPKYISSRWMNAKEQTEVGKLLISKGADGAPEIKFNLSDELIKVPIDQKSITNEKQPIPKKITEIPKEHKFAISDISHQRLAVFSEQFDEKQNSRKLVLEGNVVQKGECRPIADSLYMDLKKQRIVEARQPTRLVQQLDKAVVNYKPMGTMRFEAETRRKNDQKKSREDKDKVMDMLFTAFEKHQYYSLKDLEKITKQPVSYLKDILKEIAIFNQKSTFKNMWALKPEYAHYKPNTDTNQMDT